MNRLNELTNIIENRSIYTLFQPIVSLISGEVLGFESLSRGPKGSILEYPLDLIQAAEEYNKSIELEYLFRETAILSSKKLTHDKFLFINIDPNLMDNPLFSDLFAKRYKKEFESKRKNIIFEITERAKIDNYSNIKRIVKEYRKNHFKIAIDDAGAGYSGLRAINEIKPDYLKIDIGLIENINNEPFKQSILKSIVQLANDTSLRIIAEGIENREELNTLIDLGTHYGQGYYLQRPSECIKEIPVHIKNEIVTSKKKRISEFDYSYHYVGLLADKGICLTSIETCEDVKNVFDKDLIDGACVLDNNKPIGLVMKNHLNEALSGKYGYSLFSRKSITTLMDSEPLIVDFYSSVSSTMKLAMNRNKQNIFDDVIVMKGSEYVGIITIKKLVEFTSTTEKNYAKELNPLTHLPGNAIINRVLNDSITTDGDRAFIYVDLDHFKIYNDVYGFENGDKVINITAKLLKKIAKSYFKLNHFVGHIGGDDFLVIIDSNYHSIEEFIKHLVIEFTNEISIFLGKENEISIKKLIVQVKSLTLKMCI